MKRAEIKVCVLRVAGTNCDAETRRCFETLGVNAKAVHLNELIKQRNLMDYDLLVFPGGFSYGDYVRAGVIWAKMVVAKLGKDLKTFAEEGRLVLGICNGFQVLVEAGLLPGFKKTSLYPEAVLATNLPPGYNCRWINIKHENKGKCVFTQRIRNGEVLRVPVAHAEGRFMFAKTEENKLLKQLYDNDQLVFRYCRGNGQYAENHFPVNPNGAFHDIAGICNQEGTILGLMPHPERAFHWWQLPDWTKQGKTTMDGDGKQFFESTIHYMEKKS